jgi:hypothetical protein
VVVSADRVSLVRTPSVTDNKFRVRIHEIEFSLIDFTHCSSARRYSSRTRNGVLHAVNYFTVMIITTSNYKDPQEKSDGSTSDANTSFSCETCDKLFNSRQELKAIFDDDYNST